MGLLDGNYEDERLTKKVKPAIQGGGYNYLGKQETVTVPKRWLSDPDHVVAELAYITPKEAKVLLDLNLYGSLDGKPNNAPGGLPSLQGDMGSVGGGSSSGGNGDGDKPGGQDASRSDFNTPNDDPYGGGVGGVQTGLTTPTATPNTVSGYDSTKTKLEYLDSPEYKNIRDLTPDEIETLDEQTKQAIYSITPSKDPKNMAIGLGLNLLGIPFASTMYNNYIDATAMGYSLDNPFGNLGDFFDGSTTPTTPPDQFNGGDGRDFMNTVAPALPFVIADQVAPKSMVNEYFENLSKSQADFENWSPGKPAPEGYKVVNMLGDTFLERDSPSIQEMLMLPSPLSSDLQTSYNNAKNNINSILSTNQQSGYSAQPYGLLSSTNMASNPFNIPYLQQRGLI